MEWKFIIPEVVWILFDTTDFWGCDTLNWRIRNNTSNGVPDYIDEVAWAIDSAWSMEIVRFGFKKPYPIISEKFNSPGYKVIVESMGDYYGLTYYAGNVDNEVGARSIVTIRNNWDGWDFNDVINYQSHPEKAIRVTSVHEFFHAIQFAMTANVKDDIYLDQYPVAWLEATAVLMEDLAFDSVNDFTQYLSSFFDNPSSYSLFNQNESIDIYANSIVAMFLYHLNQQPGIKFIKDVFELNYKSASPFDFLLNNVSVNAGMSWSGLLGRFHAESFFTGHRHDKRYFIPDSKLFDTLKYTRGECPNGVPVSKRILPYGMQMFSFLRSDSNAGKVIIKCSINDNETLVFPVLNLILKGGTKDTIISSGNFVEGFMSVDAAWDDHKEAIVVISNSNYNQIIDIRTECSNGYGTMRKPSGNNVVLKNDKTMRKYLLNGSIVKSGNVLAPGVYSSNVHRNRLVIRRSNAK